MHLSTAIRVLSLQVLLFLLGSVGVNAYRILAVFPTPSISHQVVFRPLTQELAKRGHEVVVVTTDPAFPKGKAPENLIEIDLHDKSYELWVATVSSEPINTGKSDDLTMQVTTMTPLVSDVFELQMMTDEVQYLIINRTNDFDLLLIEACVRPAVSLSHVFKVPAIYVSSFGGYANNYDVMGVPSRPPLIYPSFLRQRIFNMSLWEKIVELYHYFSYERFFAAMEERDNKMIKRLFGSDVPPLTELENNVHLWLLSVYALWEHNRPVPPSVIYVGGLQHHTPPKELSEELKSFLDSSRHGVIYISFGTNVSPSSLPPHKIQMLVRVFSQLPHDVLWKWDKDELPGKTPNIRISKWWPQTDLLKHPKVKLFITQGGLQSTEEAIDAGVPLIGMPMLIDQWYNVEQYVYHKIGVRLDMELMTEESLRNAIDSILNDDSYRANIVKLRGIMQDQPQRPLERAVWWTEHVLRHGGASHLRATVANMTWADYLDLELLSVLTLAAILTLATFCLSIFFIIKIVNIFISKTTKLKIN